MEATDTGSTGRFEVFVNGELVHSKANGDGFMDEDDKVDKVLDAIRAALDGNGPDASNDALAAPAEPSAAAKSSAASPLLGGPPEGSTGQSVQDAKTSKRSLIVSIATLVISIPALIGA